MAPYSFHSPPTLHSTLSNTNTYVPHCTQTPHIYPIRHTYSINTPFMHVYHIVYTRNTPYIYLTTTPPAVLPIYSAVILCMFTHTNNNIYHRLPNTHTPRKHTVLLNSPQARRESIFCLIWLYAKAYRERLRSLRGRIYISPLLLSLCPVPEKA